jgi:hypothetical protein
MVETRGAKRVVAERQHPLYHRGTVELICAYVGPGHWAFKAPISKLWLQSYRQVPVKNRVRFIQERRSIQMTHYESAFASQATLQHALDYGLNWKFQSWGMFSAIGKCADKEVLTAAFKKGMPRHTHLNDGAALAGDLAKLKFLCKKMKCPLDKGEITVSAAAGGSVPLLKFLVKEGCEIDDETFNAAAGAGSIPVLEYLMEQEEEDAIWTSWLDAAAFKGHLHVLQWALEADTEGTIEWNGGGICCSAAQGGSIAAMQFLQQRGANLAEHNVTSDDSWAAEDSITTTAARGERKEMLLWLKQQGILPTVHAMRDAAELDMLDMCLWLHAEGCPWDATVLNSAANNGFLELVQALRERGCPIDIHTVRWHAVRHGRIDVLQYLLQLPDQPHWAPEQLTTLLNNAGLAEQLAVAKWLRQQGAEWPEVLGRAPYRKWKGKALQWARRAGCTSELPAEPELEVEDE